MDRLPGKEMQDSGLMCNLIFFFPMAYLNAQGFELAARIDLFTSAVKKVVTSPAASQVHGMVFFFLFLNLLC